MDMEKLKDIKAYPRYIKKIFFLCIQPIIDILDAEKVKKILCLQEFHKLAKENSRELKPYYDKYISEVSSCDQAISFELAVFLLVVCNIRKPGRILDLGSGFSSFIFRFYAQSAPNKPIVYSVDDSPQWLDKTSDFLVKYGISNQNVLDWQLFLASDQEKFDLILNDFSILETRSVRLNDILALVSPGGLVVMDDMHWQEYAKNALAALNKYNFRHYSLKCFTKDNFGRYSVLGLPGARQDK